MGIKLITDCEQGSPRWQQYRRGRPTATGFDKLVTPSTCKPTAASVQGNYLNHLISAALGHDQEFIGNKQMAKGTALEDNARASYAWDNGVNVQEVAFILDDSGVGFSPDGLLGSDGGLELKVPTAPTLIGYHRAGVLPREYIGQVYGSILISGRAFWDFYCYSSYSEIPHFQLRIERDEQYQRWAAAFAGTLPAFIETLNNERQRYSLAPISDQASFGDLSAFSGKTPDLGPSGAEFYRGQIVTAF